MKIDNKVAGGGGISAKDLGYTKMACGEFTPSSNVSSATISHKLGVYPKIVFFYTDYSYSNEGAYSVYSLKGLYYINDSRYQNYIASYTFNAYNNNFTLDSGNSYSCSADSTKFYISSYSYGLRGGATYHWIALA